MHAWYEDLVRITRAAPGPSAPRGAVHVLAALAGARDQDAARALGRLVRADLGVADDAPDPALVTLLVRAYTPLEFLAELPRMVELAREADDTDAYDRFRDVVRARAATEDVVLTALLVAAFATAANVPSGLGSTSARLRVLRQITEAARIVPGDSVDASFSVGRDFVLGVASYEGFRTTIYHELGHHVTNHLMSGEHDGLDEESAALLTDAVRHVLAQARDRVGEPVRAGDPRAVRLPSGLTVICSVEPVPSGRYTHFSLSQGGGPMDPEHAVVCGHLIAEMLGAPPDALALAYSPAGMCHLGFAGVPPAPGRRRADVDGIAERADAWYAELTRAGRVGPDEHVLAHLLGLGEPPTRAYPSTPDAIADLTVCEHVREGSDPGVDRAERLRAAVACGDLTALRRVLSGAGGSGQAGLARLGQSRCVLVTDTATHVGGSCEELRDVLVELRDAGFDVNEPVTDTGGTLLFDAAVRDPGLTAFLLDTEVDVHHRDRDGRTALGEAARCGNWRAVGVLLAAGARPGDRDGDGRTALHHAVASGSTETVARILARGGTADAVDARGTAPLAYAGSPELVALLCRAGADPNAADTTGRTALMTVAAGGAVDVLTALLRQGADPHAVTATGEAALHFAAFAPAGRVAALTALLDAGADLEEETDEGMTALMAAAMHAYDDAVALLLARGADPNARTVDGHTALMHASDGRTEWTRDMTHNDRMMACMRLLVDAGADLDAADDRGWRAIHYACLGFDAQPVEQLLTLGADPNVVSENGVTPLAQARDAGHEKMVEDLLKAGAWEGNA